MWLRKVLNQITAPGKDENFLGGVEKIQAIVARFLSVAMVIIILVALVDFAFFLFKELFYEPFGFFSSTIFEIFGLFLNILIALEILEKITAYFLKNVIQVELVIVTSLIAVTGKIIILDFEKTSGIDFIGLANAIFVSIIYWSVRSTNTPEPN